MKELKNWTVFKKRLKSLTDEELQRELCMHKQKNKVFKILHERMKKLYYESLTYSTEAQMEYEKVWMESNNRERVKQGLKTSK